MFDGVSLFESSLEPVAELVRVRRATSGAMRVVVKKALVREGPELGSVEVDFLEMGCEVCEDERSRALSTCGTMRVRIAEPVEGWLSWKCLRPVEWTKAARATGRARWLVDLAQWRPSLGETGEEWALLLSLVLEPEERRKVCAYTRWLDRARGVASRLLVRRCCGLCLDLDADDIEIERTKGGKPYLSPDAPRDFPNFNFNVSHDGRYVVLSSEPYCVCGIDVAAPERLRRPLKKDVLNSAKDLMDFDKACRDFDDVSPVDKMRDSLSPRELAWIRNGRSAPTGQTEAERFRCVWSAKEAITKARGDGLACRFSAIDVDLAHYAPCERRFFAADIMIDGVSLAQWTLEGQALDSGHVVCVARGPPSSVIDEVGRFDSTLSVRHVPDDKFQEDPTPDFVFLDFRDLVPDESLEAYDAAVAQDKARLRANKGQRLKNRVMCSENDLVHHHFAPPKLTMPVVTPCPPEIPVEVADLRPRKPRLVSPDQQDRFDDDDPLECGLDKTARLRSHSDSVLANRRFSAPHITFGDNYDGDGADHNFKRAATLPAPAPAATEHHLLKPTPPPTSSPTSPPHF